MRIDLIDNNTTSADRLFDRKDISILFPIANKSIRELCEENQNLMIFPYSIGISDDKIGDSPIFSIMNTSDPEKVAIRTNNLIGFIGVDDIRIKIKSRFDEGRLDYFLYYMLNRVMSVNIFDLDYNSEQEEILDLLIFFFPFFLKAAIRQGICREYQYYKHNDLNMKGPLDSNRHVKKNVLYGKSIAYTTRSYSCDNDITELIRHTIEYMKTKKYGSKILEMDVETKKCVSSIVENTVLYNKHDRDKIIQKNLRSKIHPYYYEYAPLQKLCIHILRMEELKYGESEDVVSGILIDGAWLWEEYLNTILSKEGFTHPENKIGKGTIYLFRDIIEGKVINSGRRYPDFYNKNIVLDAKYKRLGCLNRVSSVDRDDIHQLITYMTLLNINHGGFVSPLSSPLICPLTSCIKDTNSTISILGIEVDKEAESFDKFVKAMIRNEKKFVNSLYKIDFLSFTGD